MNKLGYQSILMCVYYGLGWRESMIKILPDGNIDVWPMVELFWSHGRIMEHREQTLHLTSCTDFQL